MEKVVFAFVVLVYKNFKDLEDLCVSVKKRVKDSYRIIVVDAFCDENTSQDIRDIADEYDCDYICVENRGYGFGNNRGVEYVKNYYFFEWLVICNPDITIESDISVELLRKYDGIVAPDILTEKGKHQNPYWAYKNKIGEWVIYCGYRCQKKYIVYAGVGINKALKTLFLVLYRLSFGRINKIYAAHGSFIFLKSEYVPNLVFDEEIFLFYEEADLAVKAKRRKIPVVFDKRIHIRHKEDGSINISNVKEYPILRKSYLYYFEKNIKKRNCMR